MGKTYVPATEIAKHVRKVLKDRYPNTTFSVRTKTYSGGASINVGWTDGPGEETVQRLLDRFASVSHMDITDLVHYKDVEIDGEPVMSGAHHIFAHRTVSAELLGMVAEWECHNRGHSASVAEIKENGIRTYVGGDATSVRVDDVPQARWLSNVIASVANNLHEDEIRELYEQHRARPWFIKIAKNGEVDARERMDPETAARRNAGLRGNGWTMQWVPEFAEAAAEFERMVEAVQSL